MDEVQHDEETIFNRASFAKLKQSELQLPSVSIQFGTHVDNSNLRLLELNKDLLEKIENGQDLFIRGDVDDSVVICTNDTTYDVKLCQTSNQLLVIPDSITPKQENSQQTIKRASIKARATDYLEPKPILPKIDKLHQLLPIVSVERVSSLDEIENQGISTLELLELVQASETELFNALSRMSALNLKSKWKIIQELDDIIQQIARAIDDESLNLEKVNFDELVEIINSAETLYPDWSIKHALKQISDCNEDNNYKVNVDKLAIRVGYWLLQKGPKMYLDEFIETWGMMLPGGVPTDPMKLLDFAYFGEEKRQTINFLDPLSLPNEAIRLFERLFQIKKKWSEEELMALASRITPPGKKPSVIIQKYCRAVTVNGKKVYTIQC